MFTDSSQLGGIYNLLDKACFSMVLWSQYFGEFLLPSCLR
jgi:hypothetical protein